MSDLDIDSIEARAGAATPEPWQYSDDASVIYNGTQIAQFYQVHSDDDRVADAQFTAHARGDVPALCREVRQLRDERGELRDMMFDQAVQIAELRGRLAAVEKVAAQLAVYAGGSEKYRAGFVVGYEQCQMDLRAALGSGVTPEATTDERTILVALLRQVASDRATPYWAERERRGVHHPDEIGVWLSSLIDFGWTVGGVHHGAAPVTLSEPQPEQHGYGSGCDDVCRKLGCTDDCGPVAASLPDEPQREQQ